MPPREPNVTWIGEGPSTFTYINDPSGFTYTGITRVQQQRLSRETRRYMGRIRAQEREFIIAEERERRNRLRLERERTRERDRQRRERNQNVGGPFPSYPGRPRPPPPPRGGGLAMPVIR